MKALNQYFKKTLFTYKHPAHPIFVYEDLLHRWLCFNDEFVQTIINKYVLHRPVLAYIPAFCINLNLPEISKDVVILGVGGGAIVHYINKFYPEVTLTLIEQNEIISHLAQKFFHIHHPIVLQSALEYLSLMPPCTHLFVDIFTNNLLPNEMKQKQFIGECFKKSQLAVSFNILSQNIGEMKTTIMNLRQAFNNQTLCVFIKGKANVVVHAYREKYFLDFIEQLTKLGAIHPPQLHPDFGLISQ